MGMGTKLETFPTLGISSDSMKLFNGVQIPKKKRSSGPTFMDVLTMPEKKKKNEKTEQTPLMSMFEAATILIEISNSKPFCGLEKKINSLKRKKVHNETENKNGEERLPLLKKWKNKKTVLIPTPDMPMAMRNLITEMGGYKIELVIQKKLEKTDMNKNHGRLSLPTKKVKVDFLTEEEEKFLSEHYIDVVHKKKKLKGIDVLIIDPFLRENAIRLKKWQIGNRQVYCLMTRWNKFARLNLLKHGDPIQLWSFRIDRVDASTGTVSSDLCFAMVKL